MPRLALAAVLAALVAAAPRSAAAQQPAQQPYAPTGFAATLSYGGGGELGLSKGEDEGGAGVTEIEATVGYELEALSLRPELGVVLGLRPDTNLALRPGVRWTAATLPIQVRVAFDYSNARDRPMQWRWLLVGLAGELRLTSVLGLYAELDTGAPLSSEAGVPLLVRGGASFRF